MEIDGVYQPQEQLEEVGLEPTREEMIEGNLSEEEAEQKLSDEAAKWQANSTE